MTGLSIPMQRRGLDYRRGALVSLCIAGLALCVILLEAGAAGDSPILDRLCAPGAIVNCGHVLASPWAKVGGVSAALLGCVYFGSLTVWFAAIGIPNHAGRVWRLVPLALSTLAIAFSAYFLWIMGTRLQVWCTLCIAVHAVNLLIWIITMLARPRATGEAPHPSHVRAGIVLGSAAAVAIIMGLGVWSVQLQTVARRFQQEYLAAVNDPAYIEWMLSQQPVQKIPLSDDDLVLGNAGAKNTLVVFSDYQCPSCRMFDQFARRMVNLKMDVRVVSRHFPMAQDCNPHVRQTLHPLACNLAAAMEAARSIEPQKLDNIVAFHHALYDAAAQSDVGSAVASLAAQHEIDPGRAKAAFGAATSGDRIKADVELGQSLGIEGTPAIFLNGRRMRTNWHMVTNEVRPKLDLEATDALWRRLLSSGSAQK